VLEHNLEDDKADRASAELSQTGTTPRRIEELIEVHAGDERAADRRVPS